MKPSKSTGNTFLNSREKGANSELVQSMHSRDELVVDAVAYAIANRREFDQSAIAKVVADQAELETPAVETVAEVVNIETERERFTADARRLVDEVQDEHEEAA